MANEKDKDQDKDKDVEDIEIIELGDDGKPPEAAEKDKAPVEDERLRHDEEEDEEDVPSGKDGETPEERSARRKDERRKRRERQKRAEQESKNKIAYLEETVNRLTKGVQSMETHTLQSEAQRIDERMESARRNYYYAEEQVADATAKGDGQKMLLATRAKDEAQQAYNQNLEARNRISELSQQPDRRQDQPERKAPDPAVKKLATDFLAKHDWLDPTGQKDEDSAIAKTLDVRLMNEGFDPRTDEYWDEFETRLKKHLPHKFKAEPTGRKGPPLNNGSDRAGGGKTQFYLSKERKELLMESGDWDIPERRQKMIKAYMDYDAEHAANKQ